MSGTPVAITATTNAATKNDSIKHLGIRLVHPNTSNGGDLFGPEVARHILQNRSDVEVVVGIDNDDSKSTPPALAIVGSILQYSVKEADRVTWGPGLMFSDKPVKIDNSHTVLAVRGPRTRDILLRQHGLNPLVLGDPALLSRDFDLQSPHNNDDTKKDVCFVIHIVDRQYVKELCPFCVERLVNNYVPRPREILEQLLGCQRVVSSSLHGIIFAHALGIPALPIKVGDRISGDEFKFRDHMHAVGVTAFQSRYSLVEGLENMTRPDWIRLVDEAVQPTFPIPVRQFYETFPRII